MGRLGDCIGNRPATVLQPPINDDKRDDNSGKNAGADRHHQLGPHAAAETSGITQLLLGRRRKRKAKQQQTNHQTGP